MVETLASVPSACRHGSLDERPNSFEKLLYGTQRTGGFGGSILSGMALFHVLVIVWIPLGGHVLVLFVLNLRIVGSFY